MDQSGVVARGRWGVAWGGKLGSRGEPGKGGSGVSSDSPRRARNLHLYSLSDPGEVGWVLRMGLGWEVGGVGVDRWN